MAERLFGGLLLLRASAVARGRAFLSIVTAGRRYEIDDCRECNRSVPYLSFAVNHQLFRTEALGKKLHAPLDFGVIKRL
jgi:hypothetical protein